MATPSAAPTPEPGSVQKAVEQQKERFARMLASGGALSFRETVVEIGDREVVLPGTPTTILGAPNIQEQRVADTQTVVQPQETFDWRRDQVNPQGEQLPEGAVSWNPYGEPWFGPGLGNWIKESWWRLLEGARENPTRRLDDALEQRREDLEKSKAYTLTGAEALGTTWELIAGGYEALAGKRGPIGVLARLPGLALRNLGLVFNQPARGFERTYGALAVGLQEAGEGSPIPQLGPREDVRVPPWWPQPELTEEFGRAAATLHPGSVVVNLIRTFTSPMPTREKIDRIQAALDASLIAYSAAAEPMLIEEYKKAVQAGTDPALAAMELENPLIEAAFQMIYDPGWLVGTGLVKSPTVLARAEAASEFTRLAPNLAEAVTDAARAGSAADIAASTNRVVLEVGEAYSRSASGLEALAQQRGVRALTHSGKQFHVGREGADMLTWIHYAHGQDAERTGEILAAMARLGGSAEERTEAVAVLLRSRASRPYFSEAGIRQSVVLRRMLANEEGVVDARAFIRGLSEAQSKGPEEVLEFVQRRMGPALRDMFPSLAERIARGEQLPAHVAALARFDEKLSTGIYRPINTFFAALFMGVNPGFAFRNMANNYFTMFLDYGTEVFRRRPSAWAANTRKWMLGQVVTGERLGYSPAAAAKVTGRRGPLWFALNASEKIEQNASVSIVGVTIDREMRKAIPAILPELEGIDHASLVRRTLDKFGDTDAVVQELIASQGRPLDAWRTTEWMDPKLRNFVSDTGRMEELQQILAKEAPREQIVEDLAQFFRGYLDEAAKVMDEGGVVARDSQVAAAAASGEEFMVLEDASTVRTQYEAGRVARETLEQAANDVINQAFRLMGEAGLSDAEIRALTSRFPRLFGADRYAGAAVLQSVRNQSAWDWTARIRGMRKSEDFAQVWKDMGLLGEPPPGLVKKDLLSNLWGDWYHGEVSHGWMTATGEVAGEVEKFADEVGALLGADLRTSGIHEAKELVRAALEWQYVPHSTLAAKRRFASVFGFEFMHPTTGTVLKNADAPVLEVVNSYAASLGRSFDSLDAVPPEILQASLITRQMNGALVNLARAPDNASVLEHLSRSQRTFEIIRVAEAPGGAPMAIVPTMRTASGRIPLYIGDRAMLQEPQVFRQRLIHEIGHLVQEIDPGESARLFGVGESADENAAQAFLAWAQAKLADEEAEAAAYFQRVTAETPELAQNVRALSAQDVEALPIQEINRIPPPYTTDAPPTMARVLHEQRYGMQDAIRRSMNSFHQMAGQTFQLPPEAAARVEAWRRLAGERVAEARLVASRVGNAARDWTLHAYPETKNIDSVLAYGFPYQFWYSRTYTKFLRRVANRPQMAAAYYRYRRLLEQEHAELPPWWKYNLNTDELLGIETDHPLFFNLEATLNPLNGLTGVDFDDAYKRTGWLDGAIQDLNKFGPSIWAPFTMAVAAAHYLNGEEEAAARWGGRLTPASAAFRALTALTGKPIELDPAVLMFAGGMDPYEQRRVGRALGAMIEEGLATPAEAEEAARRREGPLWDEALDRAAEEGAPGRLASYFLGAGFRARTVSDITIDRFDQERRYLQAMKPNLSPEEYRLAWERLETKYPFGATVLLSRKGGFDRDSAYAYSVLSRIPPAQSDDFAEWAGIEYEQVARFYEGKGDIEEWDEVERDQFMAAIARLGALLEMPPAPTREEWARASLAHKDMRRRGQQQFGEDIWDRVDLFYALEGDARYAYLDANPAVEQALDWQQEQILASDLLSAYYTSISKITGYYRGVVYDLAEARFGPEIWDVQDEYYALRETDPAAARRFKREHPELEAYWDLLHTYMPLAEREVARVIQDIPEGLPPVYRRGEEAPAALAQPSLPTLEDWRLALGEPLLRLTIDAAYGEEVPTTGRQRLEQAAQEFGLPPRADLVIQLVAQAAQAEASAARP